MENRQTPHNSEALPLPKRRRLFCNSSMAPSEKLLPPCNNLRNSNHVTCVARKLIMSNPGATINSYKRLPANRRVLGLARKKIGIVEQSRLARLSISRAKIQ
jgi:hypothetical protein